MPDRITFIAELSHHLKPVGRMPDLDKLAMAWFVLSMLYVVVLTHLVGPVRPDAFSQLLSTPRFLFETLSGVVAIVYVSVQAFRDAVPGRTSGRLQLLGLTLMLFWLLQYVIGLVAPTLEPASLGKRPSCEFETLLYSLVPLILAWFVTRKFYPLHPRRMAISLSLASGMMPALYMQLACMYEPGHILLFHITPGLLVMVIGLGLAWLYRVKC
ncbi:NrsF family protein [Pseudoalteromonas sp. BDTF-M6]|uniref:NrsF family protein n=1 Tax=Pseudoalteromonas sp. BDTF-M6 TaxID=2796132 RepID=UPI001BAF706A|nr:NrsF family protein [Pseudoalteromonas sp. BDTF-M6]MBS3797146.1 DUF1109 family protein [Pseudoalteromonas sp. BDTF-M6]